MNDTVLTPARTNDAYILLYHALESATEPLDTRNAADASVVVQDRDFRQQLQGLGEMGIRVVSLDELLEGAGATGPTVVLTFDDGHRSNWSVALPALIDAGLTAMFYVVAGWVDAERQSLSSTQLRDLADHGMQIGSHTLTHAFLPQLPAERVRRELMDSRHRLEDLLGRPVVDLALPGGHATPYVFAAARECGYRSVAMCRIGTFHLGDDPLHLPRLEVRRGLSLDAFQSTFRRSKLRQLQMLEFGKSCLRRSLGLSHYTQLRRLAHRCFSLKR